MLCSLSIVWPDAKLWWGNSFNGDLLQKNLCQHVSLDCCIQCPDPAAGLHQRRLDSYRQIWLSLLWGHCSFLLGPGTHKILLCPPAVSVSPVLCKFCNQIPLVFHVKFSGGSQSLCCIPRLGNLLWSLHFHNSVRTSLV